MAVNKERSVGLIILTNLPAMGGVVAVLQRRGELDHEKMGPESRPGGCQVTCHGKLREDETFLGALFRELSEELGEVFASVVYYSKGFDDFVKVVEVDDSKNEIITFGLVIDPELLKLVRFGPSTGGFKFVTREGVDKIQNLKEFDSKTGVTDLNAIAMFLDESEAVQKAFEVLGNN